MTDREYAQDRPEEPAVDMESRLDRLERAVIQLQRVVIRLQRDDFERTEQA